MAFLRFFLFLLGVALSSTICETLADPKPVEDRFRVITTIDEQTLNDEIDHFAAFGCEKMVSIRNKGQEEFNITCQSKHDTQRLTTLVSPGAAYVFTFKPRKVGHTKFWCTIDYKKQIVRFDVYNEDLPYMCPKDHDEVYKYVVHHDGVYADNDKNDQKIRALFKGHNKFMLWERYEDGESDGLIYTALVDGGMCADIPEQFNDKANGVTVCYNHCVRLYEHYGCRGRVKIVQSKDECSDVSLGELGGRVSAIEGC